MTTRDIRIKGEQLRFLAHDDEAEQLITGTATGETPTGWNFKVKGTALYWVDDDGAERYKEGTLTGGSRAFGSVIVHDEQLYFGDEDGNERYVQAITITTTTFYPSLDGWAGLSAVSLSWADLRTTSGNASADGSSIAALTAFNSDTVNNKYALLHRSIFLFDTSAIPDTATITQAIFSVKGYSKRNDAPLANVKLNVYSSLPASDIAIVDADNLTLGSTPFCNTDIAYADFSIIGYNAFILNTAGLAAISKTGLTKLGLREVTYDVGGAVPTWGSGDRTNMLGYYSERPGTSDDPKLVITYET